MGNVVFSTDCIISGITVTGRTTYTGFSADNVLNLWHLKQRWRANDVTKSNTNYQLKFDFGAAKTIDALMIDDLNVDNVIIRGHASDLGTDWSTATFNSGTITVSQDAWNERYKVYIPLTAFNYQWLVIQIPTTATLVGEYTSYFEIGRVAFLDSIVTLTENISYDYTRRATQAIKDLKLLGGGNERIALNDNRRWEGDIIIGARLDDYESQLLTSPLNRDDHKPIIFYENNGDTSKVYICLKDNSFESKFICNGVIQGNVIGLKEIL